MKCERCNNEIEDIMGPDIYICRHCGAYRQNSELILPYGVVIFTGKKKEVIIPVTTEDKLKRVLNKSSMKPEFRRFNPISQEVIISK